MQIQAKTVTELPTVKSSDDTAPGFAMVGCFGGF